MFQKDFILRLIEMFFEFLSKVLGLIQKGDYQKAEEAIDHAYSEFLKEDAAYFRLISKEKLTSELITKHNYTNGHLEILADLFYAEGELHYAKTNYSGGLQYYEKAFLLLQFVIDDSKTYSKEKEEKIDLIQKRIKQILAFKS